MLIKRAMLVIALIGFSEALLGQSRVNCDGTTFEYSTIAQGGEDESPSNMKEKAAARIQAEALGRCFGSRTTSETQIDNSKIALDRIISSLTGEITSFEIVRWHRVDCPASAIESGQSYEMVAKVSIRALQGSPDLGFRMEAWSDSLIYTEGDSVTIHFRLTKPAYVYVFDLSGGRVARLFPSRFAPDNEFPPGESTIPTPHQRSLHEQIILAADSEEHSLKWSESFVLVATKRKLDVEALGINEALGRTLRADESVEATKFGKLLLELGLNRDEVTQTSFQFEVQRKANY